VTLLKFQNVLIHERTINNTYFMQDVHIVDGSPEKSFQSRNKILTLQKLN